MRTRLFGRKPAPTQPFYGSLIVLIGLGLLAVLAILPDTRPKVQPASAPATEFSAERARAPLRILTREPHEVGTPEHARIRAFLVNELWHLGLRPEVQHSTHVQSRQGRAATVNNIVARLRGTNSTGTVLLAAHYDSVPHSYGTSDDGSGIVSILEALRAIRSGAPLRNDVVVLFSDAEELGLVGAMAFAEQNPWIHDINLVLNLEARGTTGPLVMFRTSGPNSDLVRALAGTGVTANSLAGEIFRRLPNDTDLSVFTDEGLTGMDFAFIEGLTRYHTAQDNFENQDPRTLQQMGATLLSLTRHFGEVDLKTLSPANRVYFNAGPFGLVHYPSGATLPLAFISVLVALAAILLTGRRGEARIKGALLGTLALVLAFILPILLAWFAWRRLASILEAQGDIYAAVYTADGLIAGFCLTASAVVATIYLLFERWTRPLELYISPLLLWTALAVVTAFLLPGGSYLFAWPALFSAIGVLMLLYVRHLIGQAVILVLTALPAMLLVFPWVRDLEIAMTVQMLPVITGLFVLLLLLLLPQVQVVLSRVRWVLPLVLLIAGVALPVLRFTSFEYDAAHPKSNTLGYLEDMSAKRAYWFTTDQAPDGWTGRFLGKRPVRQRLPGIEEDVMLLTATTSVHSFKAPEIRVLSDSVSVGIRHLRLHLGSPGAYAIGIQVLDADLRPGELVRENGGLGTELHVSDDAERDRVLKFIAPPLEGTELRISAPAGRKLHLRLQAIYSGLPGNVHRTRPSNMIMRLRKGEAQSDMSTVQRTVVL